MCCFVILLLSNEMQMSVRRFSAIPHLRECPAGGGTPYNGLYGEAPPERGYLFQASGL